MKIPQTACKPVAFGLALLCGGSLWADQTWKGTSDNQWTTTANWSGNARPGATDLVIYNSTSTANLSNFLSQAFTIKGIVLSNAPGPVSINSASLLTLSNSGINLTNALQSLAINAPLAVAGNQNWLVAAGQNLAVSGVLSGANYIFKDGAGTLFLNGTNTWTGALTNNGGAVWINNSSSLGAGPKTITVESELLGAGVHLNGTNGNITLATNISWVASDILGAIVNEAGSNVVGGPISVFSGGGAPYFVANAGTLVLGGAITLGTTARPMVLAGAANGFDTGGIGSAGLAVQKMDAGTWTLTTNNTYGGTTTINAGTLALGPLGTITNTPNIILASNATFDVSALPVFNLSAGSLSQTISGNGNITGNVGASGPAVIQPGGLYAIGTLAFSGNLTLNGSTTLSNELNTATTIGAGINDLITVAGNLDPQGATISISALSTLTDGTYTILTYSGSELSSFNPNITTDTGYTFTLDESVPHQINVIVSGANADLTWSGIYGPYWDLNGTPNWNSGTLTFLNADTVTFDDTGVPGTVALSGTLRPLSLTVNSSASYVFNCSAGKITGPIGITKAGSGTLTITNGNNNDFALPVTVNGGVLSVSSLSSKGSSSPIGTAASIILNGGTFQFTGAKTELNTVVSLGVNGGTIDSSGSSTLFITNLISGPGSLTKVGLTQFIIGDALNGASVAGANTYGGDTFINVGEIQIRNAGALNTGHVYVANGADLACGGGGVYDPIVNNIDLNGGDGLKTAGTLEVNDAGTIVNYAGAINLISSSSVGTINNGLVPGAFVISGSITNVGGLKKLGTNMVSLTGINSYSGGTLVSSGTLQIGTGAAAGTLGSGPVTNNAALVFNHSDTTTNSLAISGSGSLTHKGAGTLYLNGSDTCTGVTTVSGGTLLVNGSLGTNTLTVASGATLGGMTGTINGAVTVQNGGNLALGPSIGTLTFAKTLTLNSTSTTTMKLNKTGATIGNDLIQGATTINFAGTLTITASGDALAGEDTFQLFNAGAYSGFFAATNLPALGANLVWDTSNLGTGQLKVLSTSVTPPNFTSVQLLGNGNPQMTFTGPSGSGYRVWASTNVALTPITSWTLLTSNTFGASPVTYTDTTATNSSKRFYVVTIP